MSIGKNARNNSVHCARARILVAGEIAKEIKKKRPRGRYLPHILYHRILYATAAGRVDKGRRTAEDKPIHHTHIETSTYIYIA